MIDLRFITHPLGHRREGKHSTSDQKYLRRSGQICRERRIRTNSTNRYYPPGRAEPWRLGSQGPKAAKYLRGRLSLEIVYRKEIGNRSEASKEELKIKRIGVSA